MYGNIFTALLTDPLRHNLPVIVSDVHQEELPFHLEVQSSLVVIEEYCFLQLQYLLSLECSQFEGFLTSAEDL